MIELIERFELCNICRIQNSTENCFTFRQNHISKYVQRMFDYFLPLKCHNQ